MQSDPNGRRLGILLPSGNAAVEPQFAAAAPPGLSVHYTRLKLAGSTTAQLMAMADRVEDAADLLRDAGVALIAFHCTAVSMWDPELESSILSRIGAATGLRAIATSQALLAASRALGIRRIAMVSPYVQAIAWREASFLESHGIEVAANSFLGLQTPADMHAVAATQWHRLALERTPRDADACLLSCAAIQSLDAVVPAEALLGRPVITSNTAMLWYAARLLGIRQPMPLLGALGAVPLPSGEARSDGLVPTAQN